MKRIMILLALLLFLGGCRERDPTATDLLAKLLTETKIPTATIYFAGAFPEETGYLSEEAGARLYNGHIPAKLSDDFAIALCKDDRVLEIHLYHALDDEKADAIESQLRMRQSILSNQEYYYYDPDTVAPGAVVWRSEKWVCLLVTADNEKAREVLRAML